MTQPIGPVLVVVGGAKLRRSIKQSGLDMAEMTAAHDRIQRIVLAAARPPHRSGRLGKSLRGGKSATSAVIRGGGKSVPYANPIHWGWPSRHIRPTLFLTEAAARTEPSWSGEYVAHIERTIHAVNGA